MITKALLEELFEYEPLTGNLIRRTSRGGRKEGSVAGYVVTGGYIKLEVNNEPIFAHHVAWCLYHGEFPKGLIDHEDGNTANNRILNLREATHSENNRNSRLRKDSTSGVKGVCRHPCGKWIAKITLNKKRIYVGLFNDINDAAEAIRAKRIELHKEFSNHG